MSPCTYWNKYLPLVISRGLNRAFMVIQIEFRLKCILDDTFSNSVWPILTKWKGRSLKWQQPSPGWNFLTTSLMSYSLRGQKIAPFNARPLFCFHTRGMFCFEFIYPFLFVHIWNKKMALFYFTQSKQLHWQKSASSFWSDLFIMINFFFFWPDHIKKNHGL